MTGPHTGGICFPETQAFRDRVLASGGSIESGALEGLYDPILQEAKDAGWCSDLIVFAAASARKVISGSQETWFDASGNEYDKDANNTSAQRPTDTTNGDLGGRVVGAFDNTDDRLTGTDENNSQPNTGVVVFQHNSPSNGEVDPILDASTGSSLTEDQDRSVFAKNGSNDFIFFAGDTSQVVSTADSNPHLAIVRYDGASSVGRLDGAQASQGDPGDNSWKNMWIGHDGAEDRTPDADIALAMKINTALTDAQAGRLEDIINGWYSIY